MTEAFCICVKSFADRNGNREALIRVRVIFNHYKVWYCFHQVCSRFSFEKCFFPWYSVLTTKTTCKGGYVGEGRGYVNCSHHCERIISGEL
jgi:hypothetical protein